MGKRKHKRHSSEDEEREKLQDRVRWLEEQILRQREEKHGDKRSEPRGHSRRPSTRSRSRSQSYRRDYNSYRSNKSRRRQYRGDQRSDEADRGEQSSYRKDDRYSRHSRPVRREHSFSSSERGRNPRSETPKAGNSPELDGSAGREKTPDVIARPTDTRTATVASNEGASDSVVTADEDAGRGKPLTEVASTEVEEGELDADVLEVFGERLRPDRVLATAVHSHLATLWCEIIEKGLPAEDRKGFLKKFPPPKNCVAIDPPKLNAEVKAALDSTIIKRDERIVEKQEKIAASLAGVGKTIALLLKSSPADKKQYLEPLDAVAKLLADLQHDETSIRRSLILKNIKAPFKDTLKEVPSDQWLFGKELSEKIKAAKVLQQSSKDLKPTPKQPAKNWKGPPHQAPHQGQYKPNAYTRGGGYRQSYNNLSRGNSHSRLRGNKSTSRGRNYYPKQEQSTSKKSN